MALKDVLRQKIEEFRPRTTKLIKEFGHVIIDEVTIEQTMGGARDIRSLVTDISYLDVEQGHEIGAVLPGEPGPDPARGRQEADARVADDRGQRGKIALAVIDI